MRNLAAIVCCVLVALLQPLWGAQCMPKELKPCVAQCNGTSFDLSNVFVFPMTVSDFTWSPCDGVKCSEMNDTKDDCGVCQGTTDSYNACCGKKSMPVWIWQTDQMKLTSKIKWDKFPDWQVEYTYGDTWRMSIFSFIIDDKQDEPTVEYVGEDILTYSFHVIGKCIGQQTFECQKYYKKVEEAKNHRH